MNGNPQVVVTEKEYIKLTKNSKGYSWEIKVFIKDDDLSAVERIKNLDAALRLTYERGGLQ